MDRLAVYRGVLREVLAEYQAYRPASPDVELEQVIDAAGNHYQLLLIGWRNRQRVHGCILHIDIRNGKIWIQHDGTEEGITNQLVAKGIPKSDIVLGFHSPYKRQFTEFAIG